MTERSAEMNSTSLLPRWSRRTTSCTTRQVFARTNVFSDAPASLLCEDKLDAKTVQEAAGNTMKQTWELRELARKEWLKSSDQTAIASWPRLSRGYGSRRTSWWVTFGPARPE